MEREARGVHQSRGAGAGAAGGGGGRSSSQPHAEPDFLLQWGSRKRLRCVKTQAKGGAERRATTVRVDRRVVRSAADRESSSPQAQAQAQAQLLRRTVPGHRILRNASHQGPAATAAAPAMRSPQRQVLANGHHHHHDGARPRGAGLTLDDLAHGLVSKGGGGLSPPGSEGRAFVWPKFEIALSNKEKEEDFFVFKGCTKLPQRPKKRAKCIQKTLNLVCPGTWLCDLTQERYEVREKKVSKKRPRGLKAMGSMDSDSE